MDKKFKPLLAFVLSVFMSVSTMTNMYTVRADDEITQEEPIVEETQKEEETTEEQVPTEEETPAEEEEIPVVEEESVVEEEQLGDSNMMEYFLVDNPVLSSGEVENFVLSLNNAEGYSDFKLTIQKENGSNFDLESTEQVDNLVKFSRVFSEEEKGQYSVTTLHYVYNGQSYYLNFSDLEMDVKFGVDQEYDGYDATLPDLTEDSISSEGIIEVTDVNKAEEEIVNGVASQPATMSVDEFSRHATGGMTICLDPGHGGNDSGATAFGAKESDLTLKIAQYCKEELSKYDVNVVMTRTTDTRLSEEAAMDLKNRVEVAKKASASYFISIHINSAANSAAKGAEVYYPNTSGNKNLSSNGQALAKAIQSQLTALGLYDRGIKIRNYTDGTTSSNPNSSDQDYYGVIRYAKQANITGLIVEHCFISNKEEFDKYLGSNAKLQQLGIADARGIVSALGLQAKNASLDTLAAENRNVLADGTYTIQSSVNSRYILDIANGSTASGANVQLYQSNDTPAQQFKVTHDSQGYVTFTNVKSGKVLDVYNGTAKNGNNVWQFTSNNSRAQKWIVRKDGNGYSIISALNSNYVLNIANGKAYNGNNVELYSYSGSSSNRWLFNKSVSKEEKILSIANANRSAIADGTYEIRSAKNNGFVLDVSNGSTLAGANIQLWQSNGTQAQAFKVSHDSNGFVTFTSVKSGKVLDVFDGKAKPYQNVWQFNSNNSRAQKWIVQQTSSGYKIMSAIDTNYVLDLYNGSVRNGGNIQVFTSNDTIAQRWNFAKQTTDRDTCNAIASTNKGLMPDGVYYIKNQNKNFSLDVQNNSLYAGGNVWLYSLNKSNFQKWKISHDSQGYVQFENVGSGMYLAVSGSNVVQQKKSNDYNQKWIIKYDANHNLRIVSATNSNSAVDISNGSVKNGSNIQIYTANNTDAQKWAFEYINTNATGGLMQIMGTSQTTVAQMVRYYNANASGYDTFKAKYNGKYNGCLAKGGASTINQFAQIFYEEATAEGVRAEVAFTQCMKETGFLKYGGDVLPNQYNFAGIGATGAVHGASFSNVRMGIRAQIQHLKAYGSVSPLTNQCVDPRFNLVKRGSAQYVEWLGIKENPNGYGWATSKSYGHDIVNMVNVLLKK